MLFIKTLLSLKSKFCDDSKCSFKDQLANKGSLVKQYPPTPIPGNIILLWVGLSLIASIISKRLTPDSSANLDHSSIKAILTALYEFSKTFDIG